MYCTIESLGRCRFRENCTIKNYTCKSSEMTFHSFYDSGILFDGCSGEGVINTGSLGSQTGTQKSGFPGCEMAVVGNPTASIQSSNINFQRNKGIGGVPGDCRKDGQNGVAAICTSGSAIATGRLNFRAVAQFVIRTCNVLTAYVT